MAKTPELVLKNDYSRNYIINGNFDFWQRGTSFTNPASLAYSSDRFQTLRAGTAAFNILRSTDVPNAESDYSFHLDVTTAQVTIGASDLVAIRTQLENTFVKNLYGKRVTISFYVKSPKSGTHYLTLRNGLNDRTKTLPYTITASNTWQLVTLTTTLENTITYSSGGVAAGLQLIWPLAAGSSLRTTADNVWQTGALVAGSAQQNLVDNALNDFRIAQVQLVEGAEALPFRLAGRTYAEELMLCQRYYEMYADIHPSLFPPGDNYFRCIMQLPTGDFYLLGCLFRVIKRATPVVTIFDKFGTINQVSNGSGSLGISAVVRTAAQIGRVELTGAVTGHSFYTWVADAEL